MPLPITTSLSGPATRTKLAGAFTTHSPFVAGSSDARALKLRAPGRAPAAFDERERDEGDEREAGEDEEPRRSAAGVFLRKAERRGEVEAAHSAGEADEAGHHPDLLPEALRHELEHRPVADAQRRHDQHEQ